MSIQDDGLTPLLSSQEKEADDKHDGYITIRRRGRKLIGFGVVVSFAVLLDIVLSVMCCTGKLSPHWRQYLGVGPGSYPFGSAGLDLLILGLLRPLLAVVQCCTLNAVLRRTPREQIVQDSASRVSSSTEAKPHSGDNNVGDSNSNNNGSSSSSHGAHGPRWARWLETMCPIVCLCGPLVLTIKCLTRLISGPVAGGVRGLSTPWFWAAIGWSAAASGGEYLVTTGFARCCRRFWYLHHARERGDLESALNVESFGEDGKGGKRNGRYSAKIADILALCQPDWRLITCAFAALLLAATSQVLIPHFTGDMIDNVVESGDRSEFRRNSLYLVLASIACSTFSGIRGSIFTIVGARVNVRVRQRLFGSLVRQEIGFFDTTKTGDLTSRLASDCTKIGDQVTLNVNVFLRSFVMVVVTLLFMFYLSWRLSLVAFVSVPAIVCISKVYGSYIRQLSKLSQDKLAEAGTVAEESLSSMPTVRSFAAERREEKQYAHVLQDYYALNKKSGIAYGFYAGSYVLLPSLVTAIVLFYGGQLVMQGQLSGGKVVSFMIYLTSLSDGFNDMASIFSSMTQAVGAADKVFELINRKPKGIASPPPPPPSSTGSRVYGMSDGVSVPGGVCTGQVVLKGVEFEYPSRPGKRVLDGVSFTAEAGQVLALVGPSGGGKSSCIALLENLYQPSRGQVMLDGVPVHEYDHHWLHRNISIVGQEPTLYARSIRENIIYGLEDEEPSMEDVEEACRLANAHAFISQLPEKYNTQAGERGVQMSGGQKQRIAIARALVRKPRVLLLDEATSALDAESEHLVQHAIDNMISRGGMTVILIAHRLSTVKRADKIVVIRGGKVAEEGGHEELLARKGGVYSGLVKRQLELGDDQTGGKSARRVHDLGESTPGPPSTGPRGRSGVGCRKGLSAEADVVMEPCDTSATSSDD